MSEKERKPRLLYYESAFDAWVPVPDALDLSPIGVSADDMDLDGVRLVIFKRFDATDEEMDKLPED